MPLAFNRTILAGVAMLIQGCSEPTTENLIPLRSSPKWGLLTATVPAVSISKNGSEGVLVIDVHWVNQSNEKLIVFLPELESPSSVFFWKDGRRLSTYQGIMHGGDLLKKNEMLVLTPGQSLETKILIRITADSEYGTMHLAHPPYHTILHRGEIVEIEISIGKLNPMIRFESADREPETLLEFAESTHASIDSRCNFTRPILVP